LVIIIFLIGRLDHLHRRHLNFLIGCPRQHHIVSSTSSLLLRLIGCPRQRRLGSPISSKFSLSTPSCFDFNSPNFSTSLYFFFPLSQILFVVSSRLISSPYIASSRVSPLQGIHYFARKNYSAIPTRPARITTTHTSRIIPLHLPRIMTTRPTRITLPTRH
jgi:hypothetical protein